MKDVGCTMYMEIKESLKKKAEWRATANQSSD
jgi:hypothetical protein